MQQSYKEHNKGNTLLSKASSERLQVDLQFGARIIAFR